MPATTVKLDSALLEELRQMKPANQTLTALVRELLQAEIRRRRMVRAATEYTAFLEQNSDERSELELWADAPLERDAVAWSPSTPSSSTITSTSTSSTVSSSSRA